MNSSSDEAIERPMMRLIVSALIVTLPAALIELVYEFVTLRGVTKPVTTKAKGCCKPWPNEVAKTVILSRVEGGGAAMSMTCTVPVLVKEFLPEP